jgi:HCOMODA/2-hydroxy-3-carboxy-muconic semialdehyde decarboxylase
MARSIAPGLVTAADIMEFDSDGNAIDPKGRAVYLERFTHREIYKAHPGVTSVAHSHSPAVIPFGVTSVQLRPVFHLSSFLSGGARCLRFREAGGSATDMLIRTPQLSAALARPCQFKQPQREIRPGLTVGNPGDLRTGCNRSWCPKRI